MACIYDIVVICNNFTRFVLFSRLLLYDFGDSAYVSVILALSVRVFF